MAKRNKRRRSAAPPVAAAVADKLRAALRSIIRDWESFRRPLPIDELAPALPTGAQPFRVRGAESYEELQEGVIQFAGRVWQLKDGLIKWLQTRPSLRIVLSDNNTGTRLVISGGQSAAKAVEDAAKLCMPLLLCADLYNTHKHYDDCDRSGYQPFLNGVQFDGSKSGPLGIRYDGARKTGDMTVANPIPVPIRIEMSSRNQSVDFGDAVVVVGHAFNYWIPLVRQIGLLSPADSADKAILEDIAALEEAVKQSSQF